jgi:hypothetical protein
MNGVGVRWVLYGRAHVSVLGRWRQQGGLGVALETISLEAMGSLMRLVAERVRAFARWGKESGSFSRSLVVQRHMLMLPALQLQTPKFPVRIRFKRSSILCVFALRGRLSRPPSADLLVSTEQLQNRARYKRRTSHWPL